MKRIFLVMILLSKSIIALAQHDHHSPAKKEPVRKKVVEQSAPKQKAGRARQTQATRATAIGQSVPVRDTTSGKEVPAAKEHSNEAVEHSGGHMSPMPIENDRGHTNHAMNNMSHAYSLNLPMTRNGSGTGWLPDESPMFGCMLHSGKWMYMVHGNIFLRYNKQDVADRGTRGGSQFDIPNMIMFMGQRTVGSKGLFHFSTMISFDNLITGSRGYPLLFQSGETHEGNPLVDRQHPHDLFSELSLSYSHAFNNDIDAFLYAGYPGEPALGPVTFMHRPSGWENPDAPLSHHWIDATHITFGVTTLGLRYKQFKLEGSSFTGREPDENRYNFDKPLFDSRSARLSYNPDRHWALQVSHAFIKSPEALHDHNVYRTTASATYAFNFAGGTMFNATALWGMNKVKDHEGEHAALLEISIRKSRTVGYTRYEWVQKSVEELNLDEKQFGHDHIFPVNALTIGAAYDLLSIRTIRTSLGAQFTLYSPPPKLYPLYGRRPLGAEVYLRIYPELMR